VAARLHRSRAEWTSTYSALGELESPPSLIERDLGPAIAAICALYKSTFGDACVMDWTQEPATMELTARLQAFSLGHQTRGRG
jgi:hypothetical protein